MYGVQSTYFVGFVDKRLDLFIDESPSSNRLLKYLLDKDVQGPDKNKTI